MDTNKSDLHKSVVPPMNFRVATHLLSIFCPSSIGTVLFLIFILSRPQGPVSLLQFIEALLIVFFGFAFYTFLYYLLAGGMEWNTDNMSGLRYWIFFFLSWLFLGIVYNAIWRSIRSMIAKHYQVSDKVAMGHLLNYKLGTIQVVKQPLTTPKNENVPNIQELAKKRDVSGLIKALRYEQENGICCYAAEALATLGDPRASAPLLEILNGESNHRVLRCEAIKALGGMRDTRATAPLIAILKKADDGLLRLMAVEALGKIGDTLAVEPLIAALKDIDSTVQIIAAKYLGQIGNTQAIAPLKAAMMDDKGLFGGLRLEAENSLRLIYERNRK